MRNKFVLLLFGCCMLAFAQDPASNDKANLLRAKGMIDKRFSSYAPVEALAIYRQLADAGNAEAMNALGIIYSRGLCDSVNHTAALMWFSRAAAGGYANAWTNLGLMHKDGLGTPQDFAKAYRCFASGAEMNSPSAIYSQGYMLYKGLGCEQSYEKAVALFRKSIPMRSLGSMYLLGLCYRNGYGVSQNTDSARYWLVEASEAGYRLATDELMTKEPENTDVAASSMKRAQARPGSKHATSVAYRKVKHQLRTNESGIGGYYTGYAIKYDWSGKNVVGKSRISLQLAQKDNLLVGMWVEDDSVRTEVLAQLTDSALLFRNTGYERTDHFNRTTPNRFQFRNARLQLVRHADSTYLAGNLQLYSASYGEPEKPMYISLTKVLLPADSVLVVSEPKKAEKTAAAEYALATRKFDLLAYPNPFSHALQVAFSLEQEGKVRFVLSDLSGKTVYIEDQHELSGRNTRTLHVDIPAGTYVLKLYAEGKAETAIVVKQ